ETDTDTDPAPDTAEPVVDDVGLDTVETDTDRPVEAPMLAADTDGAESPETDAAQPQATMATAADTAQATSPTETATEAEAPAATQVAGAAAVVDDGESAPDDAVLELHADGEAVPVTAPTAAAAGPGSGTESTDTEAEADAGADEAPVRIQTTDSAPSTAAVDAVGADGGPATEGPTQARPAPTPTVAPIGSTQATVEVAAARAEQAASPAGAQQAAAATSDGLDAPELWRQVQRAVGSLRTNTDGDQQMTIRLRPAELGSVVVRVIANETGTNVSVVAETSAAANQLSQQRQQLTSELENSGLRGVSVDIGAQAGDGRAPGDAAQTDADGDGGSGSTAGGERAVATADTEFGFNRRLRPASGRPQLIDLDL
ncbi:MAG: flagellar hook-length control protein FliK, partial [Actinomycetota bacterium]